MTSNITPEPAWRDQLAELRFLAAKVARVHGPTHPDMAILVEVIDTLAGTAAGDHTAQAALAHRLAELTAGFHPWSGACASVHRLYAGLKAVAAALPQPNESSIP